MNSATYPNYNNQANCKYDTFEFEVAVDAIHRLDNVR